jgi:hypothetical protein
MQDIKLVPNIVNDWYHRQASHHLLLWWGIGLLSLGLLVIFQEFYLNDSKSPIQASHKGFTNMKNEEGKHLSSSVRVPSTEEKEEDTFSSTASDTDSDSTSDE